MPCVGRRRSPSKIPAYLASRRATADIVQTRALKF